MFFPFMVVFFIPFLFPNVQQYLYEWMTAYRDVVGDSANAKEALLHDSDPHNHLLAAKTFYLNPGFWYARVAFYFLGLGFFIFLVRKFSIAQDTDDKPGNQKSLCSPQALFLEYDHLRSDVDISRARFCDGSRLLLVLHNVWGLCFCWIGPKFNGCPYSYRNFSAENGLPQKRSYAGALPPSWANSASPLPFSWAYVSFSQFFLIWYANITEETRYFLLRNTENWNLLSLALVVYALWTPFLGASPFRCKKELEVHDDLLFLHPLYACLGCLSYGHS